ncbi:site-specific DNA-methyltransferase [Listeria monocytogenes]|uniref:DNA methyltransferase n=1 Tax=Listeria monocytogenes TaxID=1639 RepID=UPI00074D6C90|nr:DNA methyltransferase [Listeria monocytogenes]EAG9790476.1 site-specific DNA-methyltransferase [Listeria monocytogenes]EAH0902355.1 site-specific DNA-methyltransferase [Listeria monocytogenes]EAH2660129.1 site-specific DNA-methyltransferase [Listeria monocytogenes]EIT8055253.1 site-specific DNA-methyltransferase [Listeria monocytogenes]CUL64891.1 Type III restriction-modification system methylation subunit [Listeria monocytogenes]
MTKIEPKIFDELKKALSPFNGKYFVGEELNRSKLTDDLRNYDEALLSKLFEVDFIKHHFIKEVAGQKFFQIEQLEEAVLYNDYWDTSYTKYENRLGLASKGKFLQDSQDVVLDFPFKDGVLTASMTKEDNENGYDDAFLNEVIEKDEIDRLFDKKVFVNVKRFGDSQTAKQSTDIDNKIVSFDKDKDNLIIKGNNLLALHTLKEKYAEKVKFIYLDPPYYFDKSKPSDSFSYNSNFKLSSWLVFMKNRLEIARDLLDNDGVIFISISEDGQAYLKVLMDEVFGKNNFVETFIWRNTDNADSLGNKSRSGLEYIHSYEKVKNPNRRWIGKDTENGDAPLLNSSNGIGELRFKEGIIRFNIPDGKYKAGDYPKIELLDDLIVQDGKNENAVRMKGKFKWSQPYLDEEVKKGGDFIVKSKQFSIRYQKAEGNSMAPEKMINSSYLSKIFGVGSYEDSNSHLENLKVDFTYSKPESLIAFLMRATTDEEDVVLDFFMGSGTTQSVALKMNRRFIGIDQMDYITTATLPRLLKSIEGEQGGISKDVNWQGGGSFVYAELYKKNMGYLQDVIYAKDIEKLKCVYERMLSGTDTDEPADISFRADLSKIDWLQGFEENKRLLVKLIDKNGLYYNYSEIDDKNVRDLISHGDYIFNKSFYGGGD